MTKEMREVLLARLSYEIGMKKALEILDKMDR